MKRLPCGVLGLCLLWMGSMAVLGTNSYKGHVELDVGLVPGFTVSESSGFTLQLGDWTFSTSDTFTFLPAIAGSGDFELRVRFDPVTLGAYLDLGYVPFGLEAIGLLGEVTLVQTDLTLGEMTGTLSLVSAVTLPLYLFLDGANVSLDLQITLEPWWLTSNTDLDFSLSAIDFQEYLEVGLTLLDLTLDKDGTATFKAKLAAGTWFLPGPYGDLVATLTLTAGSLSLESVSTLSWGGFGFEEWVKLTYALDSLSFWAWLEVDTGSGVSAGLAAKWAFSGTFDGGKGDTEAK